MAVQIQWRRDYSGAWVVGNPVLAQGEVGYEIDTKKFKVGDGILNWLDLPYFAGEGGAAISAGTQSVSIGTVLFSNSNNITFGMSDSSKVTASYAFNVSAGGTSGGFSNLVFSNSHGVSFGLSGSTVTGSVAANTNVFNGGISTGGNTAGDTGMVSSRIVLVGGDNITLSGNTGALERATVTIIGRNAAFSGSNGSFTANTVTFGDSNGLQFYSTNGSMVGSYTVPSVAGLLSNINVSAGTTSNNLSELQFSNDNGVSFGLNGSTVTASVNSPFNAGLSNIGNTSGDTGMVSSRLVLAGGNNITLSGNTGALNRVTVTISAPDYAFSANNSSTFKTLTFQDSNGISFSNNAGALRITHALAGTTTGFAGANISGSMTMNTAGLNLSMSVAAPGAAAEQNAINLLGVNTAGNTTATGSTIGLSGIGIVLSGTNNSQIVMSVKGMTLKDWDNMKVIQSMNLISNITATAFSRGRPVLFPMEVEGHLEWNKAMIEMSRSTSGSNAFTVGFGIYSFVNSTQISLLGSLQNAFSATNTASVSGIRRFELSGIGTGASSLTPGHYIGALLFSANGDNTASMNYSLRGGLTANPPVGLIRPGSDSNVTANLSSIALRHFRGFWSATTANPPDTMGLTQVSMWTTGGHPYFWMGSN